MKKLVVRFHTNTAQRRGTVVKERASQRERERERERESIGSLEPKHNTV